MEEPVYMVIHKKFTWYAENMLTMEARTFKILLPSGL